MFRWQGKLRSLKLSSINPADSAVITFLSQQLELEFLHVKNCTLWKNGRDKINKLWLVLQRMPRLSLFLEKFETMPDTLTGTVNLPMTEIVDVSAMPSLAKELLTVT